MERFEKGLKTVFLLSAIETFLAMLYLLTVPVSVTNEAEGILGFSGMRFGILLTFLALSFVFLSTWFFIGHTTSTGKKLVDTLFRFSQRKSLLNLKSVLLLGTGISIYLVWKWLALPSTYEYDITMPRLLPVGFLFFVLFFQAFMVLFIGSSSSRKVTFSGVEKWVQEGQIPAKQIAVDLAWIGGLLTIASILGQMIKYFTPYYAYLDFLIVEFFLDSEQNLPTFFSSFLLLFSALILAFKARQVKRANGKFVFQWGILSFIFVYLAIDEVMQIHEMLTEPVRQTFHTSGALFFAWYIPVIPLLILLALYYTKFVLALPNRYKIGYVVSGSAYILGVIGIEIIGSLFGHQYGLGNFPYTMIATLEEVIEMSGIILFVFYNWELNQIPAECKLQ
jgi:hypothetical protein